MSFVEFRIKRICFGANNSVRMIEEKYLFSSQPLNPLENKTRSRGFEGPGLGIPLALAMIRLHGGDIEYESESGHGPTVQTWIPADRIIPMGDRTPAPRVINDAG
jgi:light-regulated signal transduction histidine kinase (bacteriophytochrome)